MIKTPSIKDLKIIRNQSGKTLHALSVPYRIDRETAMRLQTQAGYNPRGYGFYAFVATDTKTEWKCGNSCD